jgi:hypothetical protein
VQLFLLLQRDRDLDRDDQNRGKQSQNWEQRRQKELQRRGAPYCHMRLEGAHASGAGW